MQKINIHGIGDRRLINPDWFTEKTAIKVISKKIRAKDQDIYHVRFENGSRTKLHQHNGNQILIVTGGSGSLEIFKKYGTKKTDFKIKKIKKITLIDGDMVHIPANTLHTHGSVSRVREFSHIAINILPRKNATYKTQWYESDFKTNVSKTI